MSRPRGYAEKEAKNNFKKELEKGMIDIGVGSKKELAGMLNMDPRTLYRRFEDLGELRVNELIGLIKLLHPNLLLLLRMVGYSTKEIKSALSGAAINCEEGTQCTN